MTTPMNTQERAFRSVQAAFQGMPTSDGAGVRLKRLIGTPQLDGLDPFLMLDNFRSEDADDYIAGFPEHPHRGFETVTYLLAGRMRHADSAGHAGVIESGGVQWMTAGRGIVHSEMPEQEDGLLAGFQLWVNLPAAHKMDPPRYQEIAAEGIPVERREGVDLRVIAGTTGQGTTGPVKDLMTPVSFFDASLAAEAILEEPVEPGRNAFVYVDEGAVRIGGKTLEAGRIGVLGPGDAVRIEAAAAPARLLLLSGRPLNEPVARYGPFVMNTREEVMQAFEDFRAGRLGGTA